MHKMESKIPAIGANIAATPPVEIARNAALVMSRTTLTVVEVARVLGMSVSSVSADVIAWTGLVRAASRVGRRTPINVTRMPTPNANATKPADGMATANEVPAPAAIPAPMRETPKPRRTPIIDPMRPIVIACLSSIRRVCEPDAPIARVSPVSRRRAAKLARIVVDTASAAIKVMIAEVTKKNIDAPPIPGAIAATVARSEPPSTT
jgi:hypothetical protein